MSRALVIVDVQNDFCEGGSLGVPKSQQIFKPINLLKKNKNFFKSIILTKDWHPKNHVSFASRHNKEPFTSIQINGKAQQLWPDHCVAGSNGAKISLLLQIDNTETIINKGITEDVDSYSGFYDGPKGPELLNKLNELEIKEVYVCGLAFDFCVGSTALDAQKHGFDTFIIEDATRSVSKETEAIMQAKIKQSNVRMVTFDTLDKQ